MVLVSLEPLSVAVHACILSKVSVGSSVLICGAGKLLVAMHACRLCKVSVRSSVLICGSGKFVTTFSCCARVQIMQGFSWKQCFNLWCW